MRKRIRAEFRNRAAGFLHHVISGSKTLGHSIAWKIRHCQKKVGHALLTILQAVLQPFSLPFYGSHAGFGLFRLFLFSGLHMCADRGGKFLKLRSIGITFLLPATALGIYLKNLSDDGFSVETFHGKASHNELGIRLYGL